MSKVEKFKLLIKRINVFRKGSTELPEIVLGPDIDKPSNRPKKSPSAHIHSRTELPEIVLGPDSDKSTNQRKKSSSAHIYLRTELPEIVLGPDNKKSIVNHQPSSPEGSMHGATTNWDSKLRIALEKDDSLEIESCFKENPQHLKEFRDGEEQSSILHYAAKHNKYRIAQKLVELGFGLEVRDKLGFTPVLAAVTDAELNMVKLLIDLGANIRARSSLGSSALYLSIFNKDNNIFEKLLEYDFDINEARTDGGTILINAAATGNIYCLKRILDHRADINAKNNNGWNALHMASIKGHTECASLLIKNGLPVDSLCSGYGTSLSLAAETGHLDTLKTLLQHKANTEAQDTYGRTPLIIAAMYGNLDCIKELLSNGANLNAINYYEQTAITYAICHSKNECVRLLSKLGIDLDRRTPQGLTQTMYALSQDNPEAAEILVEHGADLNITYKGLSAIDLAYQKGFKELAIKWIKEYKIKEKPTISAEGLEVNIGGQDRIFREQEQNGLTFIEKLNNTLFMAVHQDDATSVYLCLADGSDPLAKNLGGFSALDLAIHNGNEKIIEIIFDYLPPEVTIEESNRSAQVVIKTYYKKLGELIASRATADTKSPIIIGKDLAERLEKGKYINSAIRKSYWQKSNDHTFLCKEDNFDLELPISSELLETLSQGHIKLRFPEYDSSLVSEEEVKQIIQELVIMILLQQKLCLDLSSNPSNAGEVIVTLTESLHNTLVGSVLIETDRMMKDYVYNSIYLPQEERIKFNDLWKERLQINNQGNSEIFSDSVQSLKEIENIYRSLGGIDLQLIEGVEPLQYSVLRNQVNIDNGWIYSSDYCCLVNSNKSFIFADNTIYCETSVKAVNHGDYRALGSEEIKHFDNDDFPSAKHLTETLPNIEPFKRQFELLRIIFSLVSPIEVMVLTGNVPDIGGLPKGKKYTTEDTQPPVISRSLYNGKSLSLEETRALVNSIQIAKTENDLHPHIDYSLYGGVGFWGSSEAQKATEAQKSWFSSSDNSRELAEAQRNAERAREEARKSEERSQRAAEEARQAENARRQAEESRRANDARQAEIANQQREASKREAQRQQAERAEAARQEAQRAESARRDAERAREAARVAELAHQELARRDRDGNGGSGHNRPPITTVELSMLPALAAHQHQKDSQHYQAGIWGTRELKEGDIVVGPHPSELGKDSSGKEKMPHYLMTLESYDKLEKTREGVAESCEVRVDKELGHRKKIAFYTVNRTRDRAIGRPTANPEYRNGHESIPEELFFANPDIDLTLTNVINLPSRNK